MEAVTASTTSAMAMATSSHSGATCVSSSSRLCSSPSPPSSSSPSPSTGILLKATCLTIRSSVTGRNANYDCRLRFTKSSKLISNWDRCSGGCNELSFVKAVPMVAAVSRLQDTCHLPIERNNTDSSSSGYTSKLNYSDCSQKTRRPHQRHPRKNDLRCRKTEVFISGFRTSSDPRRLGYTAGSEFSASSSDGRLPDHVRLGTSASTGTSGASGAAMASMATVVETDGRGGEQHGTQPRVTLIGSSISEDDPVLSISIMGASGEMALSKIYPALFALHYQGWFPKKFCIFGYGRREMSDEEMRSLITERLTCRIDGGPEKCKSMMDEFLARCFYVHGGYDSCEGMMRLSKRLSDCEGDAVANRIFYLSVPPPIAVEVARCLSANATNNNGWTRVILEKPFGRDAASSAKMTKELLTCLTEEQIYRIDHHMGKELIENLAVLRFSNLIFEPLWCRQYIRNVQVILTEDSGTEGRGKYFHDYGIIRDIVQNHLLQIIALFAMEPPVSLDPEDIRNEKVKVLRSMRKPILSDSVLGQYKANKSHVGLVRSRGYLDDPDVLNSSLTPTFFAGAMFIDNARWDGVPFLIKTGKALDHHKEEIRIQFRHVPGNLYRERFGCNMDKATNELLIRVFPDEGIFLKINNKIPGLGVQLDSSYLNLHFRERYQGQIPDSYERLLLDVIEGDKHLFIRSDELQAAWDVVTPLLEEIEENKVAPELYAAGSRGPVGSYYLGAKHNVRWANALE